MKKFFISLLVLMLVTTSPTHAQVNLGMGVGYSSLKYLTGELSVGYNTTPVFIQAGYLVHLTRDVAGGVVFYGKAGHKFSYGEWSFEPSAGYAYTLKSNDVKSLNSSGYIVSLYTTKWLNQNTYVFGGLNRISTKTWIGSLGIRFSFDEK